jgi:hypothetical protein
VLGGEGDGDGAVVVPVGVVFDAVLAGAGFDDADVDEERLFREGISAPSGRSAPGPAAGGVSRRGPSPEDGATQIPSSFDNCFGSMCNAVDMEVPPLGENRTRSLRHQRLSDGLESIGMCHNDSRARRQGGLSWRTT